MSDEKRGKDTRSNGFIKRIQHCIAEGERQLANPGFRLRFETVAEAYGLKIEKENLNPEKWMVGLSLALVSRLRDPLSLTEFDPLIELLPPLKEIKDIVSAADFDEVVKVQPADVIEDRRMPLEEFVHRLRDGMTHDQGKEQGPESRRIWGVAPKPEGDDGGRPLSRTG